MQQKFIRPAGHLYLGHIYGTIASMADVSMEKIVSLAKRRGFIYQGSEIYGGLAGAWDYGPNGVLLKNNIRDLWWKHFVHDRSDMYAIESAILMHPRVWEASGHTEGFTDLAVECKNCNMRSRADHVIEDATGKDVEGESLETIDKILADEKIKCPKCGKSDWASAANLNQMFETSLGSVEGEKTKLYLRGETAAGMFVNFKNIVDTMHPQLPFGLAQDGIVFRNEISPRDFVFRVREFELAELEYFIRPDADWKTIFEDWLAYMEKFADRIGIPWKKIHHNELADDKRAHYSERTIDLEYPYPFGTKELWAIAYRTDYDLKNHNEASGVDLRYMDQASGEKFLPHVIEPTFGISRTVFAVLLEAYTEEEIDGETRVVLKFKPELAPVKVAVLPLMKKPPLKEKAQEVYESLKGEFVTQYDETGSIGKRYRRQDEIGTPFCVTIDFDTLEKDDSVTVRDRDSMKQERVKVSDLAEYIKKSLG